MIFLAELGDKTQLAILSFAAKSHSTAEVMIGAGGALMLTTVIAALIGGSLGRFVPSEIIRYGAGVLFILFGALIIAGR